MARTWMGLCWALSLVGCSSTGFSPELFQGPPRSAAELVDLYAIAVRARDLPSYLALHAGDPEFAPAPENPQCIPWVTPAFWTGEVTCERDYLASLALLGTVPTTQGARVAVLASLAPEVTSGTGATVDVLLEFELIRGQVGPLISRVREVGRNGPA